MKDFFISYNANDSEKAEWIAFQLEAADYSTIIQAWDFRPGGSFPCLMQQALEESKRVIAVLSKPYLDAAYTHPEWEAAFLTDPTGSKGELIPVRVAECQVPRMLRRLIYIDLVGIGEEEARKRLLDGVQEGRVKPKSPPVYTAAEAEHAPGILRPLSDPSRSKPARRLAITALVVLTFIVLCSVPYQFPTLLSSREEVVSRSIRETKSMRSLLRGEAISVRPTFSTLAQARMKDDLDPGGLILDVGSDTAAGQVAGLGLILEKNELGWRVHLIPQATSLHGIWRGKDQVIAVGYSGTFPDTRGVLVSRNKDTWSSTEARFTASLNGVHGSQQGELHAVGHSGTFPLSKGVFLSLIGEPAPKNIQGAASVNAVWQDADGRLVAVGGSKTSADGAGIVAVRNVEGRWHSFEVAGTTRFHGVSSGNLDRAIAVGIEGDFPNSRGIICYEGLPEDGWHKEAVPGTISLDGIWVDSSGRYLAVGRSRSHGVILSGIGRRWNIGEIPSTKSLHGIWGSEDGAVIGGIDADGIGVLIDETGRTILQLDDVLDPGLLSSARPDWLELVTFEYSFVRLMGFYGGMALALMILTAWLRMMESRVK